MGTVFVTPNSKLPGLNFDAPPSPRDLDYAFDQVFADELRKRMQLLVGSFRSAGASYGVVDEFNPNSATVGAGRPLTVQPNDGNPLTIDVTAGVAVTKSGNVIVVGEQVFGMNLANSAVITTDTGTSTGLQGTENVVLLEYLVIDDTETNTVTEFNTVEAVRRKVAPSIDPEESPTDPDISKQQILKVVTVQDFQNPSKFSAQRLNECVVLAIVKVVPNPDTATYAVQPSILNIDHTNAVNTWVRPWFSAVDQQHREMVGTGSDLVPHKLSYNDLSGAALTLYQQLIQHGIVLSRDLDVPGCPGKLCSEYIEATSVLTDDGSGTITGTASRRYIRLSKYPTVLLGARENTLDGTESIEDKTVAARPLAVELIPNTNIVVFHRQSTTDEAIDSVKGFTIYYTSSDCLHPPALPHDLMLVAGDIIQFQNPNSNEEFVTGGKIYNELPTAQYAVGTNGPIPKNYRVWLDASRQFVEGPQVVNCARLINDATGVGTAIQTPQFAMYGPAKIRVALWNAPTPVVPSTLEVQVELIGKDVNGEIVNETLIFHGTAGSASPRQIAWNQTNLVNGEAVDAMQVSNTVFSQLDTWQIKPTPISAGANALVQLWAEIEPTVTPAINDALPVCWFNWDGARVSRVRDIRPTSRNLKDALEVSAQQENMDVMAGTLVTTIALNGGLGATSEARIVAVESFKNPTWQDNIMSKRDRHSGALNTLFSDETLVGFDATNGLHAGREWYYSQALPLQSTQSALYMVLFGAGSSNLPGFGTDTLVEYQLWSSPTVSGAWTAMPSVGYSRVHRITGLTGNFKIRFRIAGKHLSGFMLVSLY